MKSLRIELAFGSQILGTGTGFVVQSSIGPVLLTNRHNVTGKRQDDDKPISKTGGIPDRVRIIHNRKSKLGEWVTQEETLLVGGKSRWIEHPTLAARRISSHCLSNKERAMLFRTLATLRTDLALFDDIEKLRWTGPTEAFARLGARLDAALG